MSEVLTTVLLDSDSRVSDAGVYELSKINPLTFVNNKRLDSKSKVKEKAIAALLRLIREVDTTSVTGFKMFGATAEALGKIAEQGNLAALTPLITLAQGNATVRKVHAASYLA